MKRKPNGKPLRLFRVGGLWHWRVGRFGGSFYMARPKVRTFADVLASYQPTEPNPYIAGYRIIAAAFAAFFVFWLFIGVQSGFVG
jgi:hypothetical protein